MKDNLKRRLDSAIFAVGKAARSSKGKDVLMYLLFVFIAFVFWVLLSLDTEVTKDYDVPVKLTAVPDSVQFISNPPGALTVTVRGKGSQLLRFEWGRMPELNLRFQDYAQPKKHRFYASRIRLTSAVRDFFGTAVNVTSVRPDSVMMQYSTGPGVKVPVHVVADIKTALQYTQPSSILISVDSVSLYSANPISPTIKAVTTEPVTLTGLTDTARVQVRLMPIEGIKIVPDVVSLTIPVEPLIAKKRSAQIDVLGMPPGVSVITFPSRAELSYLVAMSSYNIDYPVKLFVDYQDVVKSHNSKVRLQIGAIPPIYKSMTFKPDSVEFIIERN